MVYLLRSISEINDEYIRAKHKGSYIEKKNGNLDEQEGKLV